jgi:hypothetical protein
MIAWRAGELHPLASRPLALASQFDDRGDDLW